jgi:DNA-binding response OmpR family regulator
MASILLLTNASGPSIDVLPALELLAHEVRVLPAAATALREAAAPEVVLVDARRDLSGSRTLCQLLRTTGLSAPIVLVLTEGGMAAVSTQWQADDVVLDTAGPAEVEARLRLATSRSASSAEPEGGEIRAAGVVIDEASYTAKV